MSEQPEENWERLLALNDYMSNSFYTRKKMELDLKGYTILEGIADCNAFPKQVFDANMEVLDEFPEMATGALFDRIHAMFQVKKRYEKSPSEKNGILYPTVVMRLKMRTSEIWG